MKFKKIILQLEFIFILITVAGLFAQTATAPANGDGSEGSPYEIATLENLYWITQDSTRWDKYYIQTADINAEATINWDKGNGLLPIGNWDNPFTGSYDGDGHIIDKLKINRIGENNIGLFGVVNNSSSRIENLGLTNISITGNDYVGVLVGKCYWATVKNCYTTGSVHAVGSYGGGFVAALRYGGALVESCYSSVDVTLDGYKGGGFVAYNRPSSIGVGTIKNCYSTGNVIATGTSSVYIGGFAGINNGVIENCYSTGKLTTAGTDVGGFLAEKNNTTKNCFWNINTSGILTSTAGTGKTIAYMKNYTTFTGAGWDFVQETENGTNDYWEADENSDVNNGYPILTWQQGANGENGVPGPTPDIYTLSVITDGKGTATFDPKSGIYDAGQEVSIDIMANLGYAFSYWGDDTTDTDNPKVIVMNSDTTLTANFTERVSEGLPAFPGAEGGGMYTVGGRGGRVIEVTNLNSDGPGSFREACFETGPRTIVFRVGGTIDLGGVNIVLGSMNNYLTIAGQTAPGDGIQIKGGLLRIMDAKQVIVRYLRFRKGPAGGTTDALIVTRSSDVIIDHVSAYWGVDQTVSQGLGKNITYQWIIVAEGLHESVYDDPESWDPWYYEGGVKYWAHSRGIMITHMSKNVTLHHSLFYNSYKRNPLIQDSDADVFNNVSINKLSRENVTSAKSSYPTRVNWIGNYFRFHDDEGHPPIRIYTNVGSNSGCYYKDNYDAVYRPNDSYPETAIREVASSYECEDREQPYVFNNDYPVKIEHVHDAYESVLDKAGAILPHRDADDKWVIDFVRSGGAPDAYVNALTPDDLSWPVLEGGTPPTDSDHDGMPDDWETKNGLDPNNPGDRNYTNLSSEGYTNLEVYLNYGIDGVTKIDHSQNIVSKFTLRNNYPNPFNPSTTIEFSLYKGENVSIKIYSVNGQLVRIMTNKFMSAGPHRVVFDGLDDKSRFLPSGVYFYTLSNGEQSITKKMILLK